jgi:DNA-binding NarL/FixJ family response regulator
MKAATAMKASPAKKPAIRLAVVESDPLRFVGFRALFDSETDFELIAASLPDIGSLPNIDLVLLGNRNGQNLFDLMASLKASRPDLRIIVTGSGMDEETILKAIASGAKGYVDEAASPAEFVQAIRIVNQGSVWAPRRDLSLFIERVSSAPGRVFPAGRVTFTVELQSHREQATVELAPAAVEFDSVAAVRAAYSVEVEVRGFDNTRSASALAFTFRDRNGGAIGRGPVRVDAAQDFRRYFEAATLGGVFSLRAVFPVRGNVSEIGSVEVEVVNSQGTARRSVTMSQ